MARSVCDIALMLDAMVGLSTHDPLSRPVPPAGYQASVRHARPPSRIGFSPNLGLRSIDPEVGEVCGLAVQRFKNLDCAAGQAAPGLSHPIPFFPGPRALVF